MPLSGAVASIVPSGGYEGIERAKSCSFRGLAILLRNRLEIAVYGIESRLMRRYYAGILFNPAFTPWLSE